MGLQGDGAGDLRRSREIWASREMVREI